MGGSTKRILSKMGNRRQSRGVDEEKRLSSRFGGKLVPGSGNKVVKGDIQKLFGRFRGELKTTEKQSFSVSLKKWMQLEESALPHGESPMMCIKFFGDDGKEVCTLAVLPFYELAEFLQEED